MLVTSQLKMLNGQSSVNNASMKTYELRVVFVEQQFMAELTSAVQKLLKADAICSLNASFIFSKTSGGTPAVSIVTPF